MSVMPNTPPIEDKTIMYGGRCTACGQSALEERIVSFLVSHEGKTTVIQDRQTVCSKCSNVSYAGSQISQHELAVGVVIRQMEGLLSAADLYRIRTKYGFRQTDMEQMLSTGPKTWTRWERGRVPQSRAADKLIRLIGEEPGVARRLMEMASIENSDAVVVFQSIDRKDRDIARLMVRNELSSMRQVGCEELVERLTDVALEVAKSVREQVSVAK